MKSRYMKIKLKNGACAAALVLTPMLAGGLVVSPAQAEQSSFPSGISGGAEVSLLKPHHTEGQVEGYGYDPATLVWLGYQASNGLGIRGRWWQYNERTSNPAASRYDKLKMQTFDLEATKAFTLGTIKGLVSGGLRLASYREDDGGVLKVPSAYGLVAGLELRKPIYGGLSLFGEGRQSFMFDGSWSDGGSSEKNIAFTISELKLGLEYAYPLMDTGLDLFGRVAGQAQYWNGMSDGDSENTGLFGASFMVGIRAGGGSYASDDGDEGHKYPSGITAGTEVSLLKPHHTEGQIEGYGYDPAVLAWVGYQAGNGLGIRGRWWRYNERTSNPGASTYDKIKMQTIDIEATQAFTLGSMKGLVFGGARFANYREDRSPTNILRVPSAYGLVGGVELRKAVFGGLSLFGEARQSLMFDGSWSDNGNPEKNITFTISELKLGLEYAYPLMETGLDLFGRISGQAQYWNGMSDGDTESTGLFGGSVMVGIRAGGGADTSDEAGPAHKYPRGVTGGVELSLLKPFASEDSVVGFGFDPATLVWAAYQHDNGLGIRGRWWRYNETSSNPAASEIDVLKLQTIDIEATQTFTLGKIKGLVSGGLRLAKYNENNATVVPSAAGLVAGLELQRNLIGGLSAFGEGRFALMFDNKWRDSGSERNIAFTISEAKLGLRYDHSFWNDRAALFGKVSGAVQNWNGVSDGDSESVGLFGAAFEVGVKIEM